MLRSRAMARPICGLPSATWEEAWACEIPPKPRNYCGKQSANRMLRQRYCCRIFTYEEMVFRRVAIKPDFCWWLQPNRAPRKRWNRCNAWNRRVAAEDLIKTV